MAEKITPRSQDFSQWYQDVVLQAKMADYSPVKGCMVIRPNGYAIWESIQREFNTRIQKLGVRNAYFPIFIPESFLKKEAEHVEGFAPECAVVTHAGGKELEEKLVIRPTSETIINTMFAKWIQSYRDLPMLINQWANVVRWEMRTRLFLRTAEFLWQEGHTCHATAEESDQEAKQMLMVYKEFLETVLAMPVHAGLKSKNEKFPGALNTFAVEALMQDQKALQAGTSHDLSTNFAKAFGTKFLDKDNAEKFVHQTSWGVSTRLIGGMIMTHSDDKGLVLPPRVASTHVVIIPIYGKAAKDEAAKARLVSLANDLKIQIEKAAATLGWSQGVGVLVDSDETKQPGWKFHEHELVGTPIRIEFGPRDLESKQVVLCRRDREDKMPVPIDQVAEIAVQQLVTMQVELLNSARARVEKHTFVVKSYDDFKAKLDSPGGFMDASWCGNDACEMRVKAETKATIRVILLDKSFKPVLSTEPCFVCGQTSGSGVRALFARSY